MSDGTLTLDLRKSFRWGRGTEGLIHGQKHQWGPDNMDGRGEDGQVIGEAGLGRRLHLGLLLPSSSSLRIRLCNGLRVKGLFMPVNAF